MRIEWIAYCMTCKEEVYKCPNGYFVTAAAKSHIKDNEGHKVIIGYEPKEEV